MKFEEALKAMREGKKVTLKGCIKTYLSIKDGKLQGYCAIDKHYNTYPLALSSILSEDWKVIEDD